MKNRLALICFCLSLQAFGLTFQSLDKSQHGNVMFDLKLKTINGKEIIDPTVDKAIFIFGSQKIAFDAKDVFYKTSRYHKEIFVKSATDFVSIKLEQSNTNEYYSTINHRSLKNDKLRSYRGRVMINDNLELLLPQQLLSKR